MLEARRSRQWHVVVLAALLAGISTISGSSLPHDRAAVHTATARFDRVAVRQAPDVRILDAPAGVPAPGTYELDADGLRVTVAYETTSCRPFEQASVVETPERVEIHLQFGRVHARSYVVCRLRALVGTAVVELGEPAGDRTVVVVGSSTIPMPGPS